MLFSLRNKKYSKNVLRTNQKWPTSELIPSKSSLLRQAHPFSNE